MINTIFFAKNLKIREGKILLQWLKKILKEPWFFKEEDH